MITGAHSIIYSTNPDADRAVLLDVFKLTHVDVGGGWLIFGLPPAEVAVHPSDKNDLHELYLMCDDVEMLVAEIKRHDLACSPIRDQGWGLLTHMTLPGGGKLGIYQPRHARPEPMAARRPSRPARRGGKPSGHARTSGTTTRTGAKKTGAKKTGAKKAGAKKAGIGKTALKGTHARKTGR